MSDDAELLRVYLENKSEAAFTELVRRHVDFVYGAALRMTRSPQRAEDVTQSVFIDLCRKAKALAGRGDLAGWLYLSTRYASLQLIRQDSRRDSRERAAALITEPPDDVAAEADWSRLAPYLDEVLGQLSARDRDAILLRFFKNASFAEIGSALQVSENAARMRVDRALEKTRKLLSKSGVVSTSIALELALASQPVVAAPAALVSTLPGVVMAAATTGAALTAAATGFWALMNATKITLAGIAVATLLGIGATLELKIRQTQAAIRAADADLARLPRQLAEESKRAADAERDRVRLQAVTANARASVRNAAGGQGSADAARSGPDLKSLFKDPAYQATLLAQHRARLHLWYANLYRQLQFTPEQVQRFENALISNQQADLDVVFSAASLGMPWNNPTLGGMYGKNQADLASDLQDLATVQQIEAYNQSQAGAYVAGQLGAALRDTDAPLTISQSAVLGQLIASHPANNGDFDWAAIMAEAPNVLTPSQTAMLGSVESGLEYYQQKWKATLEAARASSAAATP